MDINTTTSKANHDSRISSTASILCGAVILIIAISGLLVYLLFIRIALCRKDFQRNSYFTMAGWLGVADCICLVLMIGYAAPCLILQEDLSDTKFIGGLLNIGWFTSLPLILFLAVNRFLCICYNELYKQIFTIRYTRLFCAIALVFGTGYSVPSFTDYSPLFFNNRKMSWQWDLSRHPAAKAISSGEMVFVLAVTVITYSLNMRVFKTIHSANKQAARAGITHSWDASWERKEFIQFFVTTLWLPVFDITFIAQCYLHDPSPWIGYFVTIVYTLICSLNGWIYIIMNETVRREVKKMVSKVKRSSGNTTSLSFSSEERNHTDNKSNVLIISNGWNEGPKKQGPET